VHDEQQMNRNILLVGQDFVGQVFWTSYEGVSFLKKLFVYLFICLFIYLFIYLFC